MAARRPAGSGLIIGASGIMAIPDVLLAVFQTLARCRQKGPTVRGNHGANRGNHGAKMEELRERGSTTSIPAHSDLIIPLTGDCGFPRYSRALCAPDPRHVSRANRGTLNLTGCRIMSIARHQRTAWRFQMENTASVAMWIIAFAIIAVLIAAASYSLAL